MSDGIAVEVVHATPARQEVRAIRVPAGTTAAEALSASGLAHLCGDTTAGIGIWGRVVPPTTVLREGDRVEILRALEVDPKDARRRRQDARTRKT